MFSSTYYNKKLNNIEVVKRNGTLAEFKSQKIYEAIFKANCNTKELAENELIKITKNIINAIIKNTGNKNMSILVEEIQDLVEQELMRRSLYKTAKSYILYRDNHRKARENNALLLNINNIMDGYLNSTDWRVHENSNIDYSLGGLILHNSGSITANYWLNTIYNDRIAKAHKQGDMHIHDLGMFAPYCAGHSLKQLIVEGFGGVTGKMSSSPAKHLDTLVNQMVNFIGTMQNEWAGAQAFSSFDTYLAPYVKADKLPYSKVKQCIQSFVFSINTPSRWGSQSPFVNITLDWTVPDDLRDLPALVGGKEMNYKYEDCQTEMDMVNKAFLEVMLSGDADGRGFPYPIPTYNITKEFDFDSKDENTELLFKMTAKYGTPYFQNFINSSLNPSDVRSMCCRLQLNKKELRNRGGGLFGADEFTGSIGVVTINMPRIGYLSKDDASFYNRLEELMIIAKDSLELKRKIIINLLDRGLFPYIKRYLTHFNNHFSTIGIVGMNECLINYCGTTITTKEGQLFSKQVLNFMREKLIGFQQETGNLYNLEATPAEGTSYRLAKIDLEKHPDIITSGTDTPFYTNSTQLPVGYTCDIFAALDLQEELQTLYTGGTVFHGFLGESIQDTETCKRLVKKIAYNYRIPYFTITPTFSVCSSHGYISGEVENCPTCDKDTEIYSRVVGYYRPISNWNKGKKEEYKYRQEYCISDLNYQESGDKEKKSDNFNTDTSVHNMNHPTIILIYSDKCEKCKIVKKYLEEKDLLQFTLLINGEEPQFLLYEKYVNSLNITTYPVIIVKKNNNIIATCKYLFELKKCLKENWSI